MNNQRMWERYVGAETPRQFLDELEGDSPIIGIWKHAKWVTSEYIASGYASHSAYTVAHAIRERCRQEGLL